MGGDQHFESLQRKSELGAHLTWANQPKTNAVADASALINRGEHRGRLRPATTYPGPRPHLVASGAGPSNEPMGRGGRRAANGSGYGAGDTRLRANGVLWGGA